jgi:hypothetical protein
VSLMMIAFQGWDIVDRRWGLFSGTRAGVKF